MQNSKRMESVSAKNRNGPETSEPRSCWLGKLGQQFTTVIQSKRKNLKYVLLTDRHRDSVGPFTSNQFLNRTPTEFTKPQPSF